MKLALTIPAITGDPIKIEGVPGMPEEGLLTTTLPAIITYLLIGATLLALAFLIYGGIRWITSGGDKTGVENARKTITYAIVGLVIVFLSFFIINTIGNFFGVKLLDVPARVAPRCGPENHDGRCTDPKKSCQKYEGRWQCICRPGVPGCAF